MTLIIVAALVALVLVGLAARSLVVVPRDHAYVVERLGRYAKTIGPGVHVLAPMLDAVRQRHDLREQTRTLGPVVCVTFDNQPVRVSCVLRLAVTDPRAATYEAADASRACDEVAQTALREAIGTQSLDDVRSGRGSLGRQVTTTAARAAAGWGITVRDIAITEIEAAR